MFDIPESDYLYVKSSQIPKAGNGLYTAIDIYKGEVIAIYHGEIINRREAEKRKRSGMDEYFVNLLDGNTLDGREIDSFAKYANDASGPMSIGFVNNAKISLNDDDEVCLIAIKNIKTNEEVFCSYGNKYWNRLKKP